MSTETRFIPQAPAAQPEGLLRSDRLEPVNALVPATPRVRKPDLANETAERRQWRKRRVRRLSRD